LEVAQGLQLQKKNVSVFLQKGEKSIFTFENDSN